MVTFGFKKRKALAQIPVLLGLLLMALVVPAATKLVQENQDTRNRAASVISPPPSGCTEGYVRCFNNVQQRCQNGSWVFQKNCPNGCSGNYCKVVPTSTPRPPTPTPINCPNGACTIEGSFKCSLNKQYRCDGECWDLAKLCPNGCNENICASIPTLTPTKVPPSLTPTLTTRPTPTLTPKPSSYTCSSLGGSCVSYGCTCGTFTEGTCQGEDECCRPCPTSTPKPTATLTPTKRPTSTPTKAPSPTPTTACTGTCQYSDCLTMNMKTGVGFCPPPQYCCGEKIIAPKCNIGDKYCATDNSGVWVCKTDRSGYTLINCSSGKKCDSVTEKCVSISTPTPTKRPTSTPTRAPSPTPTTACTGTCQYSDCSIMGMKTATGKCPGPQYCCGEKILSYACNIGERTCLSDKSGVNICKPDRTGYTVFKCSEGRTCDSTTKTCVALPTATPIPTSTTTCLPENSRYEEGKCCPGLVKVTSSYGYYCGKKGTCTAATKCENEGNLSFEYKCDSSTGYYQKDKRCDFGCEGNVCRKGECQKGASVCLDDKTLQICADDGTGWTKKSCNLCSNGKCFESALNKAGEECLGNEQCASGYCDGYYVGGFLNKTQIPGQCLNYDLNLGEVCKSSSQCLSGSCQQVGGQNKCAVKKSGGSSCLTNEDCESETCLSAVKKCSPLPLGEKCKKNEECSSEYCSGDVCTVRKKTGESCSKDAECITGVCMSSSVFGSNKTCVEKKKGDEKCSGDTNCESGRCTGGKCEPFPIGSACTRDLQCESQYCPSGEFFYSTKYCASKKSEGGECRDNGECESGNCQAGGVWGKKICSAKKEGGGECSKDVNCISKICTSSNKCAPLANGATCSKDTDCESGSCFDDGRGKKCGSKAEGGAACKTDANCLSGKCVITSGSTKCAPLNKGDKCKQNDDCESKICDKDSKICGVIDKTHICTPGETKCNAKRTILETCNETADKWTPKACPGCQDGGLCIPRLKNNGESCTMSEECLSGICEDLSQLVMRNSAYNLSGGDLSGSNMSMPNIGDYRRQCLSATLNQEHKETAESLEKAYKDFIKITGTGLMIGLQFTPVGPAIMIISAANFGVQSYITCSNYLANKADPLIPHELKIQMEKECGIKVANFATSALNVGGRIASIAKLASLSNQLQLGADVIDLIMSGTNVQDACNNYGPNSDQCTQAWLQAGVSVGAFGMDISQQVKLNNELNTGNGLNAKAEVFRAEDSEFIANTNMNNLSEKITYEMTTRRGRVENVENAYNLATVEDYLRDKLKLFNEKYPTVGVEILPTEDFLEAIRVMHPTEKTMGLFSPITNTIYLQENYIIAAANHEMTHAENWVSGLTQRYRGPFSEPLEEMDTILKDQKFNMTNEFILNNLDADSFLKQNKWYFDLQLKRFEDAKNTNLTEVERTLGDSYFMKLELADPVTYKMLTADAGSVNANVNANLISKPITMAGQIFGNDPSPVLDGLADKANILQAGGLSKQESIMKVVKEATYNQYQEGIGIAADKAKTVEELIACNGMQCRNIAQISTAVANRSGLDAYFGSFRFTHIDNTGKQISAGHAFTLLKNADGSINGVIDATNDATFSNMEDFISYWERAGYHIQGNVEYEFQGKESGVYKIVH